MADPRIIAVELDEKTIIWRNADVEQERRIAIFDLLEENFFKPLKPYPMEDALQGELENLSSSVPELRGKKAADFIDKSVLSDLEREGFLEFLLDLDPVVSKLTPDWLGRQWLAFKHETILTATQAARSERAQTP